MLTFKNVSKHLNVELPAI